MDSVEQVVREVRDRVTRMESRMVQLGDHVGANLRSKQRITILPNGQSGPVVDVDSFDVSASRIIAELRSAGVDANYIDVHCMGRIIFTLYPPKQGV